MAGVYDLGQPSELPGVPLNDSVFVGWPDDVTLGLYPRAPVRSRRSSSGDARFLLLHGELDADVYAGPGRNGCGALDAAGVPSSW